jgi:hypothetical protein
MEDHSFVPDWLNKEFITSAIQKEVNGSNIDVTKCDVQLAVSTDHHFASSLLRLRVEYSFTDQNHISTTGTKHLTVKSLPKAEMMRIMLLRQGYSKGKQMCIS